MNTLIGGSLSCSLFLCCIFFMFYTLSVNIVWIVSPAIKHLIYARLILFLCSLAIIASVWWMAYPSFAWSCSECNYTVCCMRETISIREDSKNKSREEEFHIENRQRVYCYYCKKNTRLQLSYLKAYVVIWSLSVLYVISDLLVLPEFVNFFLKALFGVFTFAFIDSTQSVKCKRCKHTSACMYRLVRIEINELGQESLGAIPWTDRLNATISI